MRNNVKSLGWPLVKLGGVVDLQTGYPFKSKHYTEDCSGLKLVRGDNIAQGYLRWDNVKRWPVDLISEFEEFSLSAGDVILAMDRPWIEAGLKYGCVSGDDLPCYLVQRVSRLRGGPELETRFLRYIIGSREFTNHVLAVQTGTTVPHISTAQIKEYTFPHPPLSTQKAIANILGTLDDKIELNRRMNETLESIARAIFKSWFVDFDPVRAKLEGQSHEQVSGASEYPMPAEVFDLFPSAFQDSELGKIPEGWEVCSFSDNVEILSGGTPKTKIEEYWNGEIPWYTVKDAPAMSNVWCIDTERKITQAGLDNSAAEIFDIGTSIISARGTVGKVALVGTPMAMNQSCYGVKSANDYGDFFTYFNLLNATGTLQQRSHGSVFDTITRDTFNSLTSVFPSSELAQKFDEFVTPMLGLVLNNASEGRTLSQTRDSLLPKLLSGDLTIPNALLQAEEVL